MYSLAVTSLTLDAEPACPAAGRADPGPPSASPLRVERRTIADTPRDTWDALAALTPWATPFSGWAFQRAWWDAYGANAHEETLALVPVDAPAGARIPSRSSRSCTATRSSPRTR